MTLPKKTNKYKTALIFLVLTAYSFLLPAQQKVDRLDSLFTDLQKKGLNGNVLIAEKGKVIFKKSIGYADFENSKLLNSESIFELGSVSKQFTAMAIMILQEKGMLSYEDDINKYFPNLPYHSITIRNLLNHTSGLPDYMDLFLKHWDKSKIANNNDLIDLFVKYKPDTLFSPNRKWEYCNTGYVLLASIIEKVSGLSFAEFLDINIFKPAKMNHSLVYQRRYKPIDLKNYAFGYVYIDSLNRYILPDSVPDLGFVITLDGIFGDGVVNSTILDLLKWDRILYKNKLVSQQSMLAAFNPIPLNNGTGEGYGFGWFIENSIKYGTIVKHSGGWPGYKTYIERHIDSDKTVIIITNAQKHGLWIAKSLNSIRKILYSENESHK